MNTIGRPQQMNVRSENPFHFAPTRFTAEQAVLKRNFGSLSILALSITLLASWESIARYEILANPILYGRILIGQFL